MARGVLNHAGTNDANIILDLPAAAFTAGDNELIRLYNHAPQTIEGDIAVATGITLSNPTYGPDGFGSRHTALFDAQNTTANDWTFRVPGDSWVQWQVVKTAGALSLDITAANPIEADVANAGHEVILTLVTD